MDRIFFDKSYWKLHSFIDSAYWMVGRWHRRYHHDDVSVIILAKNCYPDDPVAMEAGLLHLILDEFCSANPQIKDFLSEAAKKYYEEMRKSKKKDKFNEEIKLSPKLKALVRDLKKALHVRKLHNQFYGIR